MGIHGDARTRDYQFILCWFTKPTAVEHSVAPSDVLSMAMCNDLLSMGVFQYTAYLQTSDLVDVANSQELPYSQGDIDDKTTVF